VTPVGYHVQTLMNDKNPRGNSRLQAQLVGQSETTGHGGALRSVVRYWAIVLAVCVLIAAALTIMLASRQRVAAPTFLVLTLISCCFAGAYLGLHHLLIGRLSSLARSWWIRLAVHGLVVLGGTALGGELAVGLLGVLGGRVPPEARARIFGVGLAVLAAIGLLQVGYERLRQRVREVELREERARRQTIEAELAALRARTDPHFLFNALNTVAGLVEEDPQRGVEVITRLGQFFRHSLQASRDGFVTLDDEVRAATTYLEIQSLRFGDRLSWEVVVEPGLESAVLPALVLQPLVENAVVHGTGESGRRVHVRLDANRTPGGIEVTVDDDGPGPGGSVHLGTGSSLADLGERLELIYQGHDALETGPSPLGGFRVRLVLPASGDSVRRPP
jgi:two-component system sensor histidine kinase AlgZ